MSNLTEFSALLNAIGDLNEALNDAYFMLRRRDEFKGVHRNFDIRRNGSGCLVEAYVESEINDNLAYCWWVEIRLEPDDWKLEAILLKTEGGNQSRNAQLKESQGKTPDKLRQVLSETISVVRGSVEHFKAG